jgi:hypothetical protein
MDECWFCGTWLAKPWKVQEPGEQAKDAPMCDKHGATTRAALRLRELGDSETANLLDQGIGIDTRPEFNKWIPPNVKLRG